MSIIKGSAHHDVALGIPKFEEIKFSDLDKKNAEGGRHFLEVLLLGYVDADTLKGIADKPDWDVEKLRIAITLNETPIIAATLEELCSEFSGRMLKQREKEVGMDDFEAAVKRQAKALFENVTKSIEDKAFDLQQQLSHLTDCAADIVQREWDAPFAYTITDEMMEAGIKFSADADNANKPRSTYVGGLYRAMTTAREAHFKRPVLKLPEAKIHGDSSTWTQMRTEMLNEVKLVLDAQGIQYE